MKRHRFTPAPCSRRRRRRAWLLAAVLLAVAALAAPATCAQTSSVDWRDRGAGVTAPGAAEGEPAVGPFQPYPDAAGAAPEAAAGVDVRELFESSLEAQLQELDTSQLEQFMQQLDDDLRRHMPSLDLRRLVRPQEGGVQFDPRQFIAELGRYLVREVVFQSRLLGQLLLLAVLCSLLQNAGKAFGNRGAAEVAHLITFLVVMYLALQSFRLALDIGQETVDLMVSFMFALLPVLATLLAAVGALSSATIFHPLLITVVTLVAGTIERVVFPLLFFTAVLAIASNLAQGFPLTRMAQLARQAAIAVLSLLFTVFLGVMAVRGALAPVADGVALRTAKFLTGTFVPVIGGMFADAVEVVAGGSVLIKNAVGAFGLMAIAVMAAFPLMKIFSLVVIYRLVTALVQPISDARIVDALGALADTLTMLMAAVATVALMFFIGVTVVVGVGNLAVMLR